MKKQQNAYKNIAIVAMCLVVLVSLFWIREFSLRAAQRDFNAMLQTAEGTYHENVIMLTSTSHAEARRLAEVFGGELRITKNGEFATITLPEDETLTEVGQKGEYRKYLKKILLDPTDVILSDTSATNMDEDEARTGDVRANFQVRDQMYEQQSYLDYLNIGNVWATSRGLNAKGEKTTVAVIDSGIDYTHPEFKDANGQSIISAKSYNASLDKIVEMYKDDFSLIKDEVGHGTAVAGVIAAQMNDIGIAGIAPDVELLVIKCNGDPATNKIDSLSDVIFGIYYAIEKDVDVINMSMSTCSAGDGIRALEGAIQLAVDSDIIVVVAAGNEGTDQEVYPASYDTVIAVGALQANSWELASYSNFGPNVDIVATGTVVTTATGSRYKTYEGTSLSAPQVTAAVAIYKSLNPYATFEEVKEKIQAAAVDLGDPGLDTMYGYGALDMNAFILEEKGRITWDYCTEEIPTSTQIFVRGHTIQTVPEPERQYIILDDWYYDKAYTRVFDYDAYYSTEFVEDITLYAKWVNEDDEDASVLAYKTLPDGTVEIVKYKGKRRYLQIPETLDGMTVSAIGQEAFARNSRLREVTFPSGLTRIDNNAFLNCFNLRKITFTGELLQTIGGYAFANCSSLRGVDVPDSVQILGAGSFSGCSKLTEVNISKQSQLESVGDYAFERCGISSIYLPKNLIKIEASALNGCEKMSAITVHEENPVYKVINQALIRSNTTLVYYPSALRGEYTIADSVTAIGRYAFASSQLSVVTIPDSVVTMGEAAFMRAQVVEVSLSQNLTKIPLSCFMSSNLMHIQIPASVSEIDKDAFNSCQLLSELIFEENSKLKSIGESSFLGCSYLKNIDLPEGLKSIGERAFKACTRLTKIRIPATVQEMSIEAFTMCTSMQTAEFAQDSVLTVVPESCFAACSALTKVVFADSIVELDDFAFSNCGLLTTLTFGSDSRLKKVGNNCFENAYALTDMQLPYGVTEVGQFAYVFSGLTAVHIGQPLTSIGWGAFGGCSSLTEITVEESNTGYSAQDNVLFSKDVTIVHCVPASREGSYTLPASVKITAPYSFYYDRLLTAVILPEGLEDIQMNSFHNCEKLKGIDIPAKVFNIGRCAFQNCYELTDVNLAEDGALLRLGIYTFVNCGIREITIPASITTMAQYVFKDCNDLTTVTFAENSRLSYVAAYMFDGTRVQNVVFKPGSALTSIQARAFSGATCLKHVDFGDAAITNVDNYAFYWCTQLESIELPDTVTFIGRYSFYGCDKMRRMDIPASTDYIGTNAFGLCKQMKVFFKTEELPANVQEGWDTDIYGYFMNAKDLISTELWDYVITYNNTVALSLYKGSEKELVLDTVDGYDIETIGVGCFRNNRNLTSITLSEKIRRIGNYAFADCSKLKAITIPASVEYIENYSFQRCPAVITLAQGSKLEKIGDYAFSENPTSQMTLPDTVTVIGADAFRDSGLRKLTIGENSALRKIGNRAFMGSQLQEIYLPAALGEVGVDAFRDLTSLKTVHMADGDVKLKLSNSAFQGSGINEVTIPARVYYIGEYTFGDCTNLIDIDVAEGNTSYTSLDGVLLDIYGTTVLQYPCGRSGVIEIPASVKVLTYASFKGAKHLTEVSFEEGCQIRTIGWQTFSGCTNLKKITIPDSVVSIDFYAFENCTSLTDVVFDEGSQMTGVYEGAFYNCVSLTNIHLPDSVIDIGEYAFYHCEALTEIPLSETSMIKGIYSYAFAGCYQISHLPSYSNIIELGAYAFQGAAIEEFTVPASLQVVDPAAFAGCERLKAIYCDENNLEYYSQDGVLYEKGSSASEIDSVVYWPADKVMIVGDGRTALYKEDTEELLRFPELRIAVADTVKVIYEEAFRGHNELRAVTIPESVIGIGHDAFEGCFRLETVNLNATHMTNEYSDSAFGRAGMGTAGLTLNIGAGVTSIPNYLFSHVSNLKTVNIAEGTQLTTIEKSAFESCVRLASIEIPEQVTSLGDGAFAWCVGLKTINYNAIQIADRNSPDSYGNNCPVFSGAGDDAILTIGAEVIRIPAWLFGGMENYGYAQAAHIAELRFEEGSKCTSIGDYAFSNAHTLKKIMIPESMERIGYYAIGISDSTEEIIYNAVSVVNEGYGFNTWMTGYSGSSPLKITIGAKVNQIPERLFYDLRISDLVFEEGSVCQSIGADVFHGEPDFVVIPASVTSLGSGALEFGEKTTIIFEADQLPANTHQWAMGQAKYYLNPREYGNSEEGLLYVVPQNSNAIIVNYRGEKAEVAIPAEVAGYPVETLDGTFSGCEYLTDVQIPDSVVTIGKNAFRDCTALKNVRIPEQVTTLGEAAFRNSGLIALEIPESLKVIGPEAFYDCKGLTSVTIPSWITTLGNNAFAGCNNLKKFYFNMESTDSGCLGGGDPEGSVLYIGANVPQISRGTFSSSGYTQIVFAEDSICQNIGGAFSGMNSLKSAYINSTNLTEASGAFSSSGDKGNGFVVTFGPDIKSVPRDMFVTNYNNYNNQFINPANVTEVRFAENSTCTEIGQNAFRNCTTLQRIAIPDTVETIGDNAFDGCTSAEITIEGDALPANLGKDWDNGAVVLHDVQRTGTTEDGFRYYITQQNEAVIFDYLGSETVVEFPATVDNYPVTDIYNSVFYGNTTVKEVILPEGIRTVGKNMFRGCTALVSVTIPDSVTEIGKYAFQNCQNLNEIVIPEGVEVIEAYSFSGCAKLTKVLLPAGITTIGESAFNGCSALSSLNLPENLQSIGTYAFSSCKLLTSIVLPENMTTMGGNVFSGCTGLTSVVIPESVTTMGQGVFDGCIALTSAGPIGSGCDIEFGWKETIPQYAFYDSGWRSVKLTRVILPEGLAAIGAGAFRNCSVLENINIPASVKTMGSGVFAGCSKLMTAGPVGSGCNIEFGWTAEIPDSSFSYLSTLSNVILPDSITSIGNSAFYECALSAVDLPDNLVTIGNTVFARCGALTEIVIPENVTTVGSQVFSGCSALKKVEFGKSVKSVGAFVFDGCSKLERVIFTGDAIGLPSAIFSGLKLTVNYPKNNETWTADVMKQYGGTITWEALCVNHEPTNTVVTAPTCTEQGYSSHICAGCGVSYVDTYVEALGHRAAEAVVENEVGVTCETDGSYDTVVYCAVCDEELNRVTTVVSATGHSYGEWTTTKEASCTEGGVKRRDCANCDHYETEELPAVGHTRESVVTAPTCTERGYTTHTCTACGDSYVDAYVDALGHDFVDHFCKVCGKNEYVTVQWNLRALLLDKAETQRVLVEGSNAIEGVVFIDGHKKIAEIAEYLNDSPDDELYLAPGQGIAFTLEKLGKPLVDIQFGVKCVTSGSSVSIFNPGSTFEEVTEKNGIITSTYTATKDNELKIDVNHTTDAYYSIESRIVTKNRIVIYNSGDEAISLSNLKLVFDASVNTDDVAIKIDNATAVAAQQSMAWYTLATVTNIVLKEDAAEETVDTMIEAAPGLAGIPKIPTIP